MTDRRVLVTGATGFIGRALVPALCARGTRVVAASRRPTASPVDAAGVRWLICDLLCPETLPAALAGIQVAYYLAPIAAHIVWDLGVLVVWPLV